MINREALLKTSLFRNYYEADGALLLELALLGKFHTCKEQLYLKRVHNQMSYALTSSEKKAHAGASKSNLSSRLTVLKGYLEAVWKSPTSLQTRLICTASIARKIIFSLGILKRFTKSKETGI